MNVLITGANGYIGRHVVAAVCDLGHNVIACDIQFTDKDPRVKYVECDLFNDDLNGIYKRLGSPDVCIHMAWRNGFIHNSDSHILDLSSHFRFLQAIINEGLKRVAVMGSMHEVGYWEGAIDETTPCNPSSLYGIAKDALRRAMVNYCQDKGVLLQWIRAYYILGDDTRNNSIFSKLIKAACEGKETFPFTSGKTKYDFITVDELAYQIARTISQDKIIGIINCCSGKPVTLSERVEQFIADNQLNIKLEYGAYPDRPYDSPIVYGDAEKINKICNS